MRKTRPVVKYGSAAALMLLAIFPYIIPQEKWTGQTIHSWLVLGPFAAPWPAFHGDKKGGYNAEDGLRFEDIEIAALRPGSGATVKGTDGSTFSWKEVKAGEKGLEFAPPSLIPEKAYACAYLQVSRWTRARLTITSPQLFQIYVDGKLAAAKTKADKRANGESAAAEGKASADLKLERGKHSLLIKTVYDPEAPSDWKIRAALETPEKFAAPGLLLVTSPEETMTLKHLLDIPKPAGIFLSPDGAHAALTMNQTLPPSDDSESWVEIYQTQSGKLLHTYHGGMSVTFVTWAPDGKRFSYVTQDKSGGTIWAVDLESGTATPLLKNVKNLGSHVWSPNGSSIIFSITEEGEKDSDLAKRFQSLEDRQPGSRNRDYLCRLTLPDKVRQRLTAGELSTNFNAFSPDGKKLLFSRSVIDYSERPYSKTELYTLDLATLKEDLVWKGKWFTSVSWGPDGKKLIFLGGPSLFGTIGTNIAKGQVPNEYDVQAYLYDLETKSVEPITRDFNPSLTQAFWPESGDSIYFTTTDRSFAQLYEYDLKKKSFSLIDVGVEVIDQIEIASKNAVAAFIGSSATVPPKAFLLDLKKKEVRLFKDPGREDYARVRFGKVEPWSFKNKKGVEIDGYVFYPPDFDPATKYPLIVNYYGGTTPITRDFGGRYPKAYYAAQGYIVYVLQPSGAIGYGQSFSALHVNDWGTIVAEEIIDGVKKFLAGHPFVDPKRVGCVGASFGGFMTMLLTTKTNMFAAAIAHAGISSISSYWGEGYWGYSYSAIATADSFPWNRRDIFVTQSPLFNADKITTPLLLLHGAVDTNVPPGESTQLFTALKLLGREVEYIQFFDQNHHVLTYNKRILWTKTIIAWFDRWLKGQPEWWFDLYPNR
jgi:dipeptidyl aminopeptidase/acylaminoacyl peptidase